MAFLKISFLIVDLYFIQVLEDNLWIFRNESEAIVSFPWIKSWILQPKIGSHVLWWTFGHNLCLILKKCKSRYKGNFANKQFKEQPSFKIEDQVWRCQQDIKTTQTFGEIGLQKT